MCVYKLNSVHETHARVCASACIFVRTVAKREEGSEHDQLYYPWGEGITCVYVTECVSVCVHISDNKRSLYREGLSHDYRDS